MKKFSVFVITLILASFLALGCGDQKQTASEAQTAPQKSVTPGGNGGGTCPQSQVPDK